MRALILLASGLAVVTAGSLSSQRIIGGEETTIDVYPFMASILFGNVAILFNFFCGSIIINNRSVLTAGHCVVGDPLWRFRLRVGSTRTSSQGEVHFPSRIIVHPEYTNLLDNDIAIIHVTEAFVFNDNVRPASIAGPNYFLADNQPVWAVGWGRDGPAEPNSLVLRHVQIYTVNQDICRNNYAEIGRAITDNMLCSGVLGIGGRDQCNGDAGGPLLHNGNVVGVGSWGERCGLPDFPGVNSRVSRFTTWIQANA